MRLAIFLLFFSVQLFAQKDSTIVTYWYSATQNAAIAKASKQSEGLLAIAPNGQQYTAMCKGIEPCTKAFDDIMPVCQVVFGDSTNRIVAKNQWKLNWQPKLEISFTMANYTYKVVPTKRGWFELAPKANITEALTFAFSYLELRGIKASGMANIRKSRGKLLVKPYVTWETLANVLK